MNIGNVIEFVKNMHNMPWLVAGKGPSLDKMREEHFRGYHIFALNHAIKRFVGHMKAGQVVISHFTDVMAFSDCDHYLVGDLGIILCMPWHPHIGFRPGPPTLENYASNEIIQDRRRTDKLLSYNSSLALRQGYHPKLPIVPVRLFSAVAAFQIMAMAGKKNIYTIGIDGGTEYACDMDRSNKLANGRKTFDDQKPVLADICHKYGMGVTELPTPRLVTV